MSHDSIDDIDREFLWRFAIITFLWLALFTVAAILLILFQDAFQNIFF